MKGPIATVTAGDTDILVPWLAFSYVISCLCTHHPRQHRASTEPATSFSVHGVGSWSLAIYHRVRTVSSCHCTSCVLTTRLPSGQAVFSNILRSLAQLSMPEQKRTTANLSGNGWGDLQLLRQCCRCCRASAAVHVSCRDSSAWSTACILRSLAFPCESKNFRAQIKLWFITIA